MGMFDYIDKDLAERVITKCPYCNNTLDSTNWQTKSFEDLLQLITISDVQLNGPFEMHTICGKCNQYIKVRVDTELKFNIIGTNF